MARKPKVTTPGKTTTKGKGKTAVVVDTTITRTRGKGKAEANVARKTTTTPRGKGKAAAAAVEATKKRGPLAISQGIGNTVFEDPLTARHPCGRLAMDIMISEYARYYEPGNDFKFEYPGSKEYAAPDREAEIETALTERQNLKVKSEEAFQRLNAFLGKNDLSADNPYKCAMQKLLHGEASSITKKVRENIFNYIKEMYGDALHSFLRRLLPVTDWDGKVAGFIVGAIEELTVQLEVHLTEIADIARLARSIIDEPVKGFQVGKGKYLKDCVRCWLHHNRDFFGNKKNAKAWVNNPTVSFSTIDPDKSHPGVCVKDEVFNVPGKSVN